jgi:hypothetical protein
MIVGVAGHRALQDITSVSRAVDRALRRIAKAFRTRPTAIVSALAEGADRLVVERALAAGVDRLIVPLPLPVPEYLKDFTPGESRDEFLRFLRRADEVIALPDAPSRAAAYEAAGLTVLTRCDVLVALWDGLEAHGRGGTGALVEMARGRCIPVAWVHTLRVGKRAAPRTNAIRPTRVTYLGFPA